MGTAELITAEQLLQMPGDPRIELVNGKIVERRPHGIMQGLALSRLFHLVGRFVQDRNLGFVAPGTGFVLARNPDTVRAPHLSFVPAASAGDIRSSGYFEFGPDLAVEVPSFEEESAKVHSKADEYLLAGTRLVWIIDTNPEKITAYDARGKRVYSGDEQVSGEDVLPGFSFKPSQLFS